MPDIPGLDEGGFWR